MWTGIEKDLVKSSMLRNKAPNDIDDTSVDRYNVGMEVGSMYLNDLLTERNMSKYRLAKISGLPQATIADICSRKAKIEKCSAETIYRIARALNVSMESLIEHEMDHNAVQENRVSFEVFKSNVCHFVKDKGDIDFILDTLSENEIRKLYDREWYAEAFYVLAMVDYLSRENEIPLCTDYNDIRMQKLQELVYPSSVVMLDDAMGTDRHRRESIENAIPEFLSYNIVESEIRDVH